MREPLNVLVLSNMYPSLSLPGRGVFVKNMVEALEADGAFSVTLCAMPIRNRSLFAKACAYVQFLFRGWYLLVCKQFDVVYVHFPTHSAVLFIPALFLTGSHIVFNFHGSDLFPRSALSKAILKLTQSLWRRLSAVVVPSTYFAEVYKERFRAALPQLSSTGHNVWISPSGGVDTNLFAPPHKVRAPDYFKAETVVLGFVGNFVPEKGWEVVVDALATMPREEIDQVKLVFVGGGPDELALKARLSGIEGLTFEVHLQLDQVELAKLFQSFDVFLFPTLREAESLGLVGIEALSCGVPVICSDFAGPATYVSDDVNGWRFKPGDSLALASQIRKFTTLQGEKRSELRANARLTACRYDSKVVGRELTEFIKTMAGSSS